MIAAQFAGVLCVLTFWSIVVAIIGHSNPIISANNRKNVPQPKTQYFFFVGEQLTHIMIYDSLPIDWLADSKATRKIYCE